MRRLPSLISVLILVGFAVEAAAGGARACGTGSLEAADPKLLIARAEVIVRAVALTYNGEELDETGSAPIYVPLIEFKVLEVLKGEAVPETLHFRGRLTNGDDFHESRTAFTLIRPSGLGGACHAYEYKKDAEFLLVMKRRDSGLTPYWASTAPSNQQLRGPDDPWLGWVRSQLNAGASN